MARKHWALGAVDVALLVAAVVGALTVSDEGTPPPAVRSASTQPTTALPLVRPAWTNNAIHPVTSVLAVGGRLVVYGSEGNSLTLYGLDPATGQVAWQRAASTSATTPGIGLRVLSVADAVVYLRPDPVDALGARLVAADPATGADRAVGAPAVFYTPPMDCGDNAHVCANVEGVGLSAFSAKDGSQRPLGLATERARAVGDEGLYDLGGRTPELLAVVAADGTVRWSVPLESIFGPGHSTDSGWEFDRYTAEDLYVGSVGPRRASSATNQPNTTDMTQLGTAGIAASTGNRQWFIPNSYIYCQGTVFVAPAGDEHSLPVLCRYAGTETYDPARRTSTLSGPTTVFGFDPRNGSLTWQWNANADASLVNPERPHAPERPSSSICAPARHDRPRRRQPGGARRGSASGSARRSTERRQPTNGPAACSRPPAAPTAARRHFQDRSPTRSRRRPVMWSLSPARPASSPTAVVS